VNRNLVFIWAVAALAWLLAAQAPQPDGAGVERGVLPASWATGGPKCMEEPEWRVHEYNPDFYILRESGCVHYEKPFLYLIFGESKVMLLDTGAGKTELFAVVDGIIQKWLKRKQRTAIQLMVMHSHGHGDHVARDKQFEGRPGVEFVSAGLPAVQRAFGIAQWPDSMGVLDLGNRVLDVVPVPGHDAAAVALYDRRTAILLTGDSFYPGRLYISDWAAFAQSTQRLVDFTEGKLVAHILGCHIEQTSTPYLEYPIGSFYQPQEHVLELSRGHLLELNSALKKLGAKPQRLALRDMTIFPVDAATRREMQQTRRETESRLRPRQYDQNAAPANDPKRD